MKADIRTKNALTVGRKMASTTLRAREKALRNRAKALRRVQREPTTTIPVEFKSTLAARLLPSRGVLVAEGDSWFDYPWNDILQMLEDEHGYDVVSVAHKGDRVEDMAYSGGQLEKFIRAIEKVMRTSHAPRAILLSGGGNDIAGDEFAMLLNHALSPTPGLNDSIVSGVIDERLQYSYVTILSAITKTCTDLMGATVPILIHGYDYPVPDGRGFMGGWWLLPGPWLKPGFDQKAYSDRKKCTALVGALIDRFNAMLKRVASLPGFSHVKYVDLRGTLSTGANWTEWWANELHPTPKGFAAVTDRIVRDLGL